MNSIHSSYRDRTAILEVTQVLVYLVHSNHDHVIEVHRICILPLIEQPLYFCCIFRFDAAQLLLSVVQHHCVHIVLVVYFWHQVQVLIENISLLTCFV